MSSSTLFVVEGGKIVVGGAEEGSAVTETPSTTQSTTQSPPENNGAANFFSSFSMIAYFAVLIAAMYFFMIRPQRKRDKELKELQNTINVGDPIITSSGMYGKVVDMSENVFIIEFGTNKGVRIPMQRSEIIGVKEPNFSNKKSEDNQ